jgi:micrococcal nuclease
MRLTFALLATLFIVCACATEPTPRTARTVTLTATAVSATTAPTSVDESPAPTPAVSSVTFPDGLTQALVVRVVDGDTIDVEIEGETYRLRYIGIDTPETVDPNRPDGCFGPEASLYNRALVEGKTVGLEKDVSDTDRFGRLLRYVWLPDESTASDALIMVNATLVAEGYAQASTYPPDVKYQDTFLHLQQEAREAGRGLWGALCTSPTPTLAPVGAGDGSCEFSGTPERVIKGNISTSTGEKIYHVPGQQFYDATVINETKGERWFCTEAEAVAAGWRKAKV